jgi:hypothetical protein
LALFALIEPVQNILIGFFALVMVWSTIWLKLYINLFDRIFGLIWKVDIFCHQTFGKLTAITHSRNATNIKPTDSSLMWLTGAQSISANFKRSNAIHFEDSISHKNTAQKQNIWAGPSAQKGAMGHDWLR